MVNNFHLFSFDSPSFSIAFLYLNKYYFQKMEILFYQIFLIFHKNQINKTLQSIVI